MNNKIKVCHIHTDPKFGMNQGFNHEMFDNRIYYLLNEYDFNGVQHNGKEGEKLMLSRASMKKIISATNECDVVVLYGLDNTTSYVSRYLLPNVFVIWRFFGAELYGKINEKMYSPRTSSIKQIKKKQTNILSSIKEKLKLSYLYGWDLKTLFDDAVKRADAIAMLYKQEYEFLTQYFQLPPFLQLSYVLGDPQLKGNKKESIIIGNSRNKFNNHLEILDIINSVQLNYQYEIPFNYGSKSEYSNVVAELANANSQVHLIENFMPFSEYQKMYEEASAFVLNAYRQMAMGNIFIALRCNVKIYMNTRNSAYWWLKDEGFAVFSLEDFKKDLMSGNISLSNDELEINGRALERLNKKYSVEAFQNDILALLNTPNDN